MINDSIALTSKTATANSTAAAAPGATAAATVTGASAPPAAPVHKAAHIDMKNLQEQLAAVNRMLKEQRSNLAFSVDEGTGKTVVRVVKESTGEVIRQIPSEEALVIATTIRQSGALSSLGVEVWS